MKLIIEEEADFIVEQIGWGRYVWQGIGDFQFLQSAIEFTSPFAAATHAQRALASRVYCEIS